MSAFGATTLFKLLASLVLQPGEECENLYSLMRLMRSMSNIKEVDSRTDDEAFRKLELFKVNKPGLFLLLGRMELGTAPDSDHVKYSVTRSNTKTSSDAFLKGGPGRCTPVLRALCRGWRSWHQPA